RETLDGDKRIHLERDGKDERGHYRETINEKGERQRLWDSGHFSITDARGERIAEGEARPFKEGQSEGRALVDDKTGRIVGLSFEKGPRAGENYSFRYDEQGKINQVTYSKPGSGEAPAQAGMLTRNADGTWQPPDSAIPGFETPRKGAELKVKANGDMLLDQGDGIKERIAADGSKEVVNTNDYSRERMEGDKKVKEYWDGYEWRKAKSVKTEGKVTTVEFEPNGTKPTKIVRDSEKNTLNVEFADKSRYEANWNEQSQKFVDKNGQATNYFNTGERGTDGRPIWRKGVRGEDGIVDYEDQKDDKLPTRSKVDPRTGEITSLYKSGAQITRNRDLGIEKITYPNGQTLTVGRNTDGQINEFVDNEGVKYTRRGDMADGPNGTKVPRWEMQRIGESLGTFDGNITVNGARVEKVGADGKATIIEDNGRITNKQGDKVVSIMDKFGRNWIPESRDGKDGWTLVGDEKGRFEGELTLLDDGRVAVKTKDGIVSRNPDHSTSKFDDKKVETERLYDNGAKMTFENGRIKQTVDANNVVRDFSYMDTPNGPVISKVTVTEPDKPPRVAEALFQDPTTKRVSLRTLNPGASADSQDPKDFGAPVAYSPDGSSRREFIDDKTVTQTDIHGGSRTDSGDQRYVKGEIRSPADRSRVIVENGMVKRTEDGTGQLTRDYLDYMTPPGLPKQIKENRSGQERTFNLVTKQVGDQQVVEKDAKGRPIYEVNGQRVAYDPRMKGFVTTTNGVDRVDLYNGESMLVDGRSGMPAAVLDTKGDLSQVTQKDSVFDFKQEDGTDRVYVSTAGPPPSRRLSEEKVETMFNGEPRQVYREVLDPNATDPAKRYGRVVEYDKTTGTRTVYDGLDEQGYPTSAVESRVDGSRTHYTYDDEGTATKVKEEMPDKSVKYFEGGKLTRREFDNGAKIFYDNKERPQRTVDVAGNERRFELRDDGQIDRVFLKRKGETAETKVEERSGPDLLTVPGGNKVVYNFGLTTDIPEGTRVETLRPSGTTPGGLIRDQLDGTQFTQRQGQQPEVRRIGPETPRASDAQPDAVTRDQSQTADGIIADINKAEGKLNETLTKQLEKLLADAEENGNRDQVERYLEDTLARNSKYRMSFQGGEEGEPRTATVRAIGGDTAPKPPSPLTPGGGSDTRSATLDAPAGAEDLRIHDLGRGSLGDPTKLDLQRSVLESHVATLDLPPHVAAEFTADLKTFIDNARERGIPDSEIATTLFNANRLMEASDGDLKPPLDTSDTVRTALDLIHDAARNSDVNKGDTQSCGPTSTMEQLLARNPALASQIAADALLKGEFTHDGFPVILDPASMKATRQARDSMYDRARAQEIGLQNQLGQVMTHALSNYALQKDYAVRTDDLADRPFYTRGEPSGQNRTGESAYAFNPKTQKFETLQNTTGVNTNLLADLNETFLGRNNVVVNSRVDEPGSRANHFDSPESLMHELDTGLDAGYDMTLVINANHPAFSHTGTRLESSPSPSRPPQQQGDWHAVTVTDSKDIDGVRYYRVSDSRGADDNNFNHDRWISAEDLDNASNADKDLRSRTIKDSYVEAGPGQSGDISPDGLDLVKVPRPAGDSGTDPDADFDVPEVKEVKPPPPPPDIPPPADSRSTLERAKETFGDAIPGYPLTPNATPSPQQVALKTQADKFFNATTDEARTEALRDLSTMAAGGDAAAQEMVRNLAVVNARLDLARADKGRGTDADQLRQSALERLADLSGSSTQAQKALNDWIDAAPEGTDRSQRRRDVESIRERSSDFSSSITQGFIDRSERALLGNTHDAASRAQALKQMDQYIAQEILRTGEVPPSLAQARKELGVVVSTQNLADGLSAGNADQTVQSLRELRTAAEGGDAVAKAVLADFNNHKFKTADGEVTGAKLTEMLDSKDAATVAKARAAVSSPNASVAQSINNNSALSDRLDQIKLENGDLALRLNDRDIPRLRQKLVDAGDGQRLAAFDKGVEEATKERAQERDEIKEAKETFLDRSSSPADRQEAIAKLEKLLQKQHGADRTELARTIDIYKAGDRLMELKRASGGHTVDSLTGALRRPETAPQAVERLVAIANGGNGDDQQARQAQEVLKAFAKHNPDQTVNVIDALIAGRSPSDRLGTLNTAVQIARAAGEIPDSLRNVLQEGLQSENAQERKNAFYNMVGLSRSWTPADAPHVAESMDAGMAQ
ncbi:MAG: hypothetical protein K2Z81_07635, partial [Cyanobacteria bacterium]|nr:hypothetical protein [Cyanobacteriota bacterium]